MKIQSLLTLAATSAFITSASASISMDWVNVGDPGNLAQSAANRTHAFGTNGDGYGAVADTYRIGRDLVTNNQYATFLNATAASDPYGLYNANMSSSTHGGITQNGSSGSFDYLVKADMGNKPVNLVSWFDAARFTNWLHNGQGSGSTETGAYTLNGATTGIITKNSGATVWIPAEDEWFKAAYYNGATGQYSLYATGADTISTAQANYASSVGTVTDVGVYDIPSYYGTYDQAGNVWEWNDAVSGSSRGLRGGAWFDDENYLRSSGRFSVGPTLGYDVVGFRVASVPEPSALVLTMLFSAALVTRRKR